MRWWGGVVALAVAVVLSGCNGGDGSTVGSAATMSSAPATTSITAAGPATSPTLASSVGQQTLQEVCDGIERDGGQTARSLLADELTGAERADLYDELVPVYQRGLSEMFDVAAPSPDLEDDLDAFRLSIGQKARQMTLASAELRSGAAEPTVAEFDLDRIVESNQAYAQALGVGPCGLGDLPADVPPSAVSADDVDALRTVCSHLESRIAEALPSPDNSNQFLLDLHGAVLGAQSEVKAVSSPDLERTLERSLHDFEDALLDDSGTDGNSQQFLRYRDQMETVRTLLQKYGGGSNCGLDFTTADFTTGPTSTTAPRPPGGSSPAFNDGVVSADEAASLTDLLTGLGITKVPPLDRLQAVADGVCTATSPIDLTNMAVMWQAALPGTLTSPQTLAVLTAAGSVACADYLKAIL